jgi:uncharacterized protein YycO
MSLFNTVLNAISVFVGKTHWKTKKEISADHKEVIRQLLAKDYYIILTNNSNHLSSYAISFAQFLITGKFGFWSHILMNTEGEVQTDEDFRLIEAVGDGVHFTPFDEVFKVQKVALMKPKSMTIDKWTAVLEKAKTELGKPYDTIFDLKSDSALSCVELVRTALMAEPDYMQNFAAFENMVQSHKNLTPGMFYTCPDFEVVFAVKA